MSIAVITHTPFEHAGRIADAVRRAGFELQYVDAAAASALPDPLRHEAIVLMGGPMSTNDRLPWIEPELALIRRAAETRRPVLGVCLGAQLVAKALGGRVYPNPSKEIGWFPIHWTETAASDPLFHELPDPLTTFHWHGETFDLPSGAEWLAYSDLCRNQAFRYGSNIYGLQFHIEVTPDMIDDWCGQQVNCADLRELTSPPDPNAWAVQQEQLAAIVFDRWTASLSRE
jgi:GMP synthase-like glutamine amidotransferase